MRDKELIGKGQIVVLGLVGEKERHGYEIEQVIQRRLMREWIDISFSSVYDALNKLERKGFIKSRLKPTTGPGPAQKVYSITAEGKKLLKENIKNLISETRSPNNDFDSGLAFLWVLSKEEILDSLNKYESTLLEKRGLIEANWGKRKQYLAFYGDALFERQLLQINSEIEWLRLFKARVEKINNNPITPNTD